MPIGISRAPYLKFEKPGDRHGGELVDFRVVQKTDFDTNRPQYFAARSDGGGKTFDPFASDGSPNQPICQWEFTVDTGVADELGETERRIFLDPRKGQKGTPLEGKRGQDAVEIALKKAKAHRVGLELGGKIFIQFDGKLRSDKKSPETTTWSAEYEPPEGGPGSGKVVDEVPWLVGGARFDAAAREEQVPSAETPAFDLRAPGEAVGAGVGAMVAAAHADEEPPF